MKQLPPGDDRYLPVLDYVEYVPVPEIIWHTEELYGNRRGDHLAWNTCEHYKCSSDKTSSVMNGSILFSKKYAGSDASAYFGTVQNPYGWYNYRGVHFGAPGQLNSGLPKYYEKRLDNRFIPAPVQLDQLEQQALTALLPKIKAEMSLVNSIIELKDFKPLLNKCTKQVRSFIAQARQRGLFEALMFTVPHYRDHDLTLSQIAKRLRQKAKVVLPGAAPYAANKYLEYSFAWAPLYSDILALKKAISTFQRRLNDLITREGRVRVGHFQTQLSEHTYVADTVKYSYPSIVYPWLSTLYEWRRQVYPDPSQFHVQIRYNYHYTQYQRENARVLGLLDALGVNLNPQIIWNALPWSFVIDWVIGVNRWLGQFAITNMEPQINIHEYLWSISRRRRIAVTRTARYTNFSGPTRTDPNVVTLPLVFESSYRREKTWPKPSSITSSGLTLKEVSLGAALVITRSRSSYRRGGRAR